jgi:hypothetical protein
MFIFFWIIYCVFTYETCAEPCYEYVNATQKFEIYCLTETRSVNYSCVKLSINARIKFLLEINADILTSAYLWLGKAIETF